jgi:pyruvate dehydrogenase E2 component (dihydrolipoamide acetyltransferase)
MAEIIEMPKLSDTMTTGTLINWLKKEGEAVAAGDMIAEVETDKATMEVECFEDGFILKHYIKEGESVAIGAPICAVGAEGEAAPAAEVEKAPPPEEAKKKEEGKEKEKEKEKEGEKEKEEEEVDSSETAGEEKAAAAANETTAPAPATDASGRVKASPLARKVAKDLGVDLAFVSGTGPGGRVTREDVEKAAKEGTAKPAAKPAPSEAAAAPAGKSGPGPAAPAPALLEEKSLPVSNMRAAIAKALVASKTQAPHFYLQMEVDGAPLNTLRQDLNARLADLPPEQGGVKFTINDLILRAAAEAVRRVPAINRSWQGDTIKQHGSVHLAFGVAVDDGLVTPVIRDAHAKSLRQIAQEAKALIGKARNRKLKPDEMSGSTLTVTNLGMYGISDFYGILNPPNAAILSVGATVKTPVVDEAGNIVVGYRMKVGLSGDHRVIDGAVGAQYLQALRQILETPATMLV